MPTQLLLQKNKCLETKSLPFLSCLNYMHFPDSTSVETQETLQALKQAHRMQLYL